MRYATVDEYIQAAKRFRPAVADHEATRRFQRAMRRFEAARIDRNLAWADRLYSFMLGEHEDEEDDYTSENYALQSELDSARMMVRHNYDWPTLSQGIIGFPRLNHPRFSSCEPFATADHVFEILANSIDAPIDAAHECLINPRHKEPSFLVTPNALHSELSDVGMPDGPMAPPGFDDCNLAEHENIRFLARKIVYFEYARDKLHALQAAKEEFWRQVKREEADNQRDLEWLSQQIASARRRDPDAIRELVLLCHRLSPYPAPFPREIGALYDPDRSLLMIQVEAPYFDDVDLLQELVTKTKPVSKKIKANCQEFVIRAMALRVLHELFSCEALADAVAMIAVNLVMNYVDRRNGKRLRGTVASLAVTRDAFADIDVRHVDAKACFRALKGIAVPSVENIVPVPPILAFDADRRVIAAQPVIDGLSQATNLAAMEWDEFEHLVRELFAKEFLSRSPSAEVKVTRASRDWGVDAIIFDPDPLLGGKFVIQAKRYTNTVEVSAVRDLYGTVVNEGANRGILVTTSTFGPDAHEFATGKPISLLDGANLLALLKKHGYDFTIDLPAARAARLAEVGK